MGEVEWGFKDFVNVITVSCHLDRLLSEAIVLQLEHLVIVSLFGNKLIMSTHFGYLAVIEDYYHISVFGGGDTLGYYYLCTWKVEVSKAVLNILSVSISTAEVVSSRIRMAGFMAKALARESLCFCPPERPTPRSPTIVS